ncbi:MAG: hypothetical protein Q8P12_04050 [bacterium]|nr:hypothetical protein [bacterium]
MQLLKGFSILPSFFHRNGKGHEEIEVPSGEVCEAAVAVEPARSFDRRASVPIEEVMAGFQEVTNREKGVAGSKIRCTVDEKGTVHVSIGFRPEDGYKKGSKLEALKRRLRNQACLQTGIPKKHIDVRRNLKIPPPADDTFQGPALH